MSLSLAALLLAAANPAGAGALPVEAPADDAGRVVVERIAVSAEAGPPAVARLDSAVLPAGPFRIDYHPGEALDARWIERQFLANGLVGQPVALDRLAALVQDLSLAFVRNGYVNSGVLPGTADRQAGGRVVLNLRLVSGGIAAEDVSVEWRGGARGLDAGYLLHRLPSAQARPLDGIALEQDFRRLAADEAIGTVKADLLPGTAPGAARLALLVEPAARLEIQAGLATDRSPAVGGLRYGTGFALRSALVAGDRIAFDGGLTAGRPDAQLAYRLPLFGPGLALSLRASANRAAVVDAPLRALDIRARETGFDGALLATLHDRPLAPPAAPGEAESGARRLTATLGLLRRTTRTTLLGEPFSFSPGSVRGRAAYAATRLRLDWSARSSRAAWLVGLALTVGLRGTRADVPGIPRLGRHFRTLRAEISHARRMGGSGLELRLRLNAQGSSGPVFSAERFAAGGSQSVRGYRENLLLADEGAFASLELARPLNPGGGFPWGKVTPALFVEAAALRNRGGAIQPDPRRIASVGLAVVWAPLRGLEARASYGKPLVRATVPGSRDVQDAGLSFALAWRLAP